MVMKRCENGHYFDTDKYSSCPACGVPDLNITHTVPVHRQSDLNEHAGGAADDVPTIGRDQCGKRHGGLERDEDATVALVRRKMGIDPVVAWLVCIEGEEKGRDYRIRSERNFVGRSPKMDICLGEGDKSISRDNHAVISFNPKKLTFLVMPGDGRGIVYLNENEVAVPTELHANDILEMGQSKFLFVPLCGGNFSWK